MSASVHAGRKSSGNLTFLDMYAHEKGCFAGAVRNNTYNSFSPQPFGTSFARSTPQCLQFDGTAATLFFDEGVRMSKSALVVANLQGNSTFLSFYSGDSQPGYLLVHLQGRMRKFCFCELIDVAHA